ncbi:hypothetical protein H112_07272 [Trichophyton rubrum D6]|uniref:Uncharacterized protein n=4 Tax=Trichophyton TaxID=5550 RepID=F2SI56_TRIRC|nr:uncharacterized protein TERG_08744 [Trichophyton rubrum CBS 118892]EZF11746.1 hypothetical protein H100_07298 [Trichophyton rubrum MR850]EZF38463.1 hypothetical protein H102_07259 [Trichophyton rubrum CBS 100081]EZF49158.1 hypothetical protein H103_07281 [Trichophyton rubrum CBS 288.86]EZF59803.1 hypothetical protein H104_07234 [Trichophyton rubrum CBS 289.86]EZF70485.1 hypothetical protein H105_07296 [Trichophyton soudanense CBS 452.61]EZF81091.1 hypothetical protein H110_07280 [Trichophy
MSTYIHLVSMNGTFTPGPTFEPPPSSNEVGNDTPSKSSIHAHAGSLPSNTHAHDDSTTKQENSTPRYKNMVQEDLKGIGSWADDQSIH